MTGSNGVFEELASQKCIELKQKIDSGDLRFPDVTFTGEVYVCNCDYTRFPVCILIVPATKGDTTGIAYLGILDPFNYSPYLPNYFEKEEPKKQAGVIARFANAITNWRGNPASPL